MFILYFRSTYVPEERTRQEVRKLDEPMKVKPQQQVELFLFEKQRLKKRAGNKDDTLIIPAVVPVGSQHITDLTTEEELIS